MSSEHDDETPPIPGDTWGPDEAPPEGFADRVMRARAHAAARASVEERTTAAPTKPPSRRARRAALIGIVVMAAASATFFLWPNGRGGTSSGSEDALARTSVRLGGRGVAVAETGARLAWHVEGGAARVTQVRGDVFYRVEPGGPFVVSTPAGEVEVTGTCFRVRLTEEKNVNPMIKGGAIGAALATVAVVTVYEGVVKVHAQGREVSVPAGQAAKVIGGDAPRMLNGPDGEAGVAVKIDIPAEGDPAADAPREELLARDRRHRDQIAALAVRLGKAEGELQSMRTGGPRPPSGLGGERKFYDFTPEELKEMAKNCEIRYAIPQFGLEAPRISDKQASKLGLTAAQVAQGNQYLAETNEHLMKELRALYVEATGDAAGAETLDPQAMQTEIERKSGVVGDDIRKKIAEELAGLRPPGDPTSGPPLERLTRMLLAVSREARDRGIAIGGKANERMFVSNSSIVSGCSDEE